MSQFAELAPLRPRFLRLYSGAISDVLDDLGSTGQVMSPSIVSLRPGARWLLRERDIVDLVG